MSELYIKQRHLDELTSIFNKYCPNALILAYGSRVKGDAHEGSDLDLVVKKFGQDDCDLYELREYLRESNIPFLIDVLEYDNLPESFKSEIDKINIQIYPCNEL